jgi:hypothetical protein
MNQENREVKTRPMYECRCDERLKTEDEKSTRLLYTGLTRTSLGGIGIVHGWVSKPELLKVQKNGQIGNKKHMRESGKKSRPIIVSFIYIRIKKG